MYQPVTQVHVSLEEGDRVQVVGRLAFIKRRIYFEYSSDFVHSGLELSPFILPLSTKTYCAESQPFGGLFGLFNDCLPDGWGRLLLDRQLRAQSIAPETLSPLDRLTHVGRFGMGALTYEPDTSERHEYAESVNLEKLAAAAAQVLEGSTDDVFPELLELSGSSCGARPKVLVGLSIDKKRLIHGKQLLPDGYAHWLVKFAASHDQKDIGAIEYAYSQMANASGVEMMPTHLFPAKNGSGFFGVQRFDRIGNNRIHMHSLSGLLQTDHQLPSLDYKDAMKAALSLTRNMKETTKIFRMAAFNVLAHNRDDHAKNFAFLMDERRQWRVSPAFDLTFASGPGGEHCTTIMGEGRNPTRSHLEALAHTFGIKKSTTREIIDRIQDAIALWPKFASEAGVRRTSMNAIRRTLES